MADQIEASTLNNGPEQAEITCLTSRTQLTESLFKIFGYLNKYWRHTNLTA